MFYRLNGEPGHSHNIKVEDRMLRDGRMAEPEHDRPVVEPHGRVLEVVGSRRGVRVHERGEGPRTGDEKEPVQILGRGDGIAPSHEDAARVRLRHGAGGFG